MTEEGPVLLREGLEELLRDFHQEDEEVVYLDHAGATLSSRTQLQEVFRAVAAAPFANPHSLGPLGERCEDMISSCRMEVLKHFGADPSEYDCVFTSGSTAALKLVAECFPWGDKSALVYPYNAHTSVLGMREFSPSAYCVPSALFHDVSDDVLTSAGSTTGNGINDCGPNYCTSGEYYSLLVVPGECNFSGTKMDKPMYKLPGVRNGNTKELNSDNSLVCGLEFEKMWPGNLPGTATVKMSDARENQFNNDEREVFLWMLDASKLASTSVIDLSNNGFPPNTNTNSDTLSMREKLLSHPHFVCVSFYKIFGYPTGVGALLIRKDMTPILKKRYFGGGTVSGVVASTNVVQRPKQVVDAGAAHVMLEDGTLNYHGILALPAGFAALKRAGGIENIQSFTFSLTQYLYKTMTNLHHSKSNMPLCEIYGRHREHNSMGQGSIITFNLRWADGSYVGFGEVGEKAAANGIQLRVGCFCSIGGCQEALHISSADMEENIQQGRTCQDSTLDLTREGRPTGAVRVSIGYMTTVAHVNRLVNFIKSHFLDQVGSTLNTLKHSNVVNRENEISGVRCDKSPTIYMRSIYVYPIKSCAGFKVRAWPLGPSGLHLDREWAVINSVTGIAITQKSHPLLSHCQPVIDIEKQIMTVSPPASITMEPLVVSLAETKSDEFDSGQQAPVRRIRVCFSQHVAKHCTLSADAWFSSVLGSQCQLVRRNVKHAISSVEEERNISTNASFSNSAQFLLLSMSSLQALQEKMIKSGHIVAKVESFRPNFVVDKVVKSSCEYDSYHDSHEEDYWHSVSFSLKYKEAIQPDQRHHSNAVVNLINTGPCARCSMVNIVPPSAGSGFDVGVDINDADNGVVVHGTRNISGINEEIERPPQNGRAGLDVLKSDTLKTLATYRKGQHMSNTGIQSGSNKNDIYFGAYFAYDPSYEILQLDDESVRDVFSSCGYVYENMPVHVNDADH